MHFNFHPNLNGTLYFISPSNDSSFFNSTFYGYSPVNSYGYPSAEYLDDLIYNRPHIPYPGGGSYYWGWYQISQKDFINVDIPVSFLNLTKKDLGTEMIDSITIGSIDYSTSFSMAYAYDYNGTESYDMGTTAVYESGLVAGTNQVVTFNGTNLTTYDGVLTLNGNATITRYQWVEFGPLGNVVETTNDYSTDGYIYSLNQSGDRFHIHSYYSGYINFNQYNNSSFSSLPLSERYSVAFGTYFNGSTAHELWGSPGQIAYITNLSYNHLIQWYEIYSSIEVTTSNILGAVLTDIGILVGLTSVGLALGVFPIADEGDLAAIMLSLIGFGVKIASLYES